MPILASANSTNSKPAPAGTHPARCVQIVDLGTHVNSYGKPNRRVRFTWELPNETIERDGKKMPMVVSKKYTLSLSEKSNLRKDLESWRGSKFTDEQLKGFDITKVLGVPCLVSIVHKSEDGKTYANVDTVTSLPKGFSVPPQVNPSVEYNIDMERNDIFQRLPTFIQDEINKCLEWNGGTEKAEPAAAEETSEQDKDNIPF